jgi:rubredoxin
MPRTTSKDIDAAIIHEVHTMRTWQCVVCGFVYNEAEGIPEDGIASGTPWEDVPPDWSCPECAVSKAEFVMVELA